MNEVGNVPKYNDVLSWAESSAVVYANSVIGARTNRNSGIIELFGGIIGKVPEFGLLTDEGRKATWVIDLKTSYLTDAQVLGSAIGMKVMGAASASNGAVGLYHGENITPEAINIGEGLICDNFKRYIIDDEEIERVINTYPVMWKNTKDTPKVCFIGCPHLSFSQLHIWTDKIRTSLKESGMKKVKIKTILTAAPDVVEKFKKEEHYKDLIEMGVSISSICPLMYMNNPICSKKAIITNSNKLRTYTTARYFIDSKIINIIKGVKVYE